MRRGVANLRRLRRPMNAVMLLRQIDPNGADWTIWAGEIRAFAFWIRVPEQFRVVVERGHLLRFTFHLPMGSGSCWLPLVTGAWNSTLPLESSTVAELVACRDIDDNARLGCLSSRCCNGLSCPVCVGYRGCWED